jgi:hypothetical protein
MMPNPRSALDARMPLRLQIGGRWPGPSKSERET